MEAVGLVGGARVGVAVLVQDGVVAQLAPAQLVEGEVAGGAVQPAPLLIGRDVPRGLAPRADERLLAEVGGRLRVTDHALQPPQERAALLVEDRLDGRHVPDRRTSAPEPDMNGTRNQAVAAAAFSLTASMSSVSTSTRASSTSESLSFPSGWYS
jgi:hypothetical protein